MCSQLLKWTAPGTFSIYTYHGPQREKDPAFLAKYDVVLTTYSTLEYEYRPPSVVDGEEPPPALTEKEKKRIARTLFVERVKAFYSCAVREMSQGAGIKRVRPKVQPARRHDYRLEQESKPTLAQWLEIKEHVERQLSFEREKQRVWGELLTVFEQVPSASASVD